MNILSAATASRHHKILPGIQYLRGLAAVLVVVIHANAMMRYPEYFGKSPERLFQVGLFGVALFFVISGFVMAMVALDEDGASTISAGDFVRRRFIRIVPFMWLCILGYNALSFVGTRQVEWGPFIRALTLWPVGDLKPNVIWTLRHELLFYCLFALSLLGVRRHPKLLAAWLAAPLIVALAAPLFANRTWNLSPSLSEVFHVVVEGSANGANLQFGAGLILGLLWLKHKPFMAPSVPFGPFSIVAAVLGATAAIELATPHLDYPPVRLLVWTTMAGLLVWLGLVVRETSGWPDQLGRLLGDASYSIYLVHNAVLLVLLKAGAAFKTVLPSHVFWLIFILLAVLMGVVVHKVVEAPTIRWLSRWLAGSSVRAR